MTGTGPVRDDPSNSRADAAPAPDRTAARERAFDAPGSHGKRKVFGIGFQKTGTTTLGVIFDRLGYRTAGYHQFRDMAARERVTMAEIETRALDLMARHDAAKDTPWPLLYERLDRAFPGSKFIHVTRDTDAWIASAVKDFDSHDNAIHRAVYGVPFPRGHEDVWIERYERHNREVAAYFDGRPDDCLFLRLEEVTFEAVCDFLGAPRVGSGAPRANTRTKKRLKTLWWRLRRRLGGG